LLRQIQQIGHRGFLLADKWFNSIFGSANNPLYHLGTLSFFFFYILLVSGIYVYIFFETGVNTSYESVDALTEQWYLGGVMRSLHRYASDAMLATMILHLLRGFFSNRYRGARWFSWSTGVPMLAMVFILGLTGYWLVWDQLGQFVAVRTMEMIDWLPIIAEPTARNFLTNTSITDLFFRLLVVTHLGLGLFLLGGRLLHVNRLNEAKINPPRALATGAFLALVVLSLIKPALSHAPADLSISPTILNLDWFYMFFYPLMDIWPMGYVWALVAGGTMLVFLLPWLPPQKREHIAEVYLDDCSGCNLCVQDCPYEAIRLEKRSDGHPRFSREAMVIAEHCVSCGICVGSCPFSTPNRHSEKLTTGIDMPNRNIQHLRNNTLQAIEKISGDTKILVYGCDHAMEMEKLAIPGVAALSLPCTGALPPSFIDYAIRHGADGVILTGCRKGDCFHRPGNFWVDERLAGTRKPQLNRSFDRRRLMVSWAAISDKKELLADIETFRQQLSALDSQGAQVSFGAASPATSE
jgi:coenzyme F420-reducing hydrogenase delta subunit/NAD-dependent dihydropyrimidine dehydrogenase PreA subunit